MAPQPNPNNQPNNNQPPIDQNNGFTDQPPIEDEQFETYESPEADFPMNQQQANRQPPRKAEEEWGVDHGPMSGGGNLPQSASSEKLIISEDVKLPLEICYHVISIFGKRGSGKSYTVGKMVEQMMKNRLQFILFDPMDAHGEIELPNLVHVTPTNDRKINMERFLRKLKETNKSVIVNLSKLKLDPQRKILAEFTEMLIDTDLGKPIMTIVEECQDFIPQTMSLKVRSLQPIIRFTKLGRQRGYGVCFVTQRPASASKECLTQSSLYIVHNILNTTDLNALRDMLAFGTDKQLIRDILNDVTKFTSGYFVAYSPDFIKENSGVIVSKTGQRETRHKGKNVEIHGRRGMQRSPWDEGDTMEDGSYDENNPEPGDMSQSQSPDSDFVTEGIGPEDINVPMEPGLEPGQTPTLPGMTPDGTMTEGGDQIGPDGMPVHSPKRGSLIDKDIARDALGIGLGIFAGVIFFVIAKKSLEPKVEE